MNKICSVIVVGALMSSLVGCATADRNDARTNQYQGYQMGTNDTNANLGNHGLKATGRQATKNANGSTNITNTAQGYKGQFNDVSKGQWYTENIEWAKDTGIIGGYPGGSFQPNKPVTRAEMTAILRNLSEKGYINIPDQTDQTPAADTTPATPDTTTPGTDTTPDTTPTPGADTTPDTTTTPGA